MHPEIPCTATDDPLGTIELMERCIADLEGSIHGYKERKRFHGGTSVETTYDSRADEAVFQRLQIQCSPHELAERNAFESIYAMLYYIVSELRKCIIGSVRGNPHIPRLHASRYDVCRSLDAHERMAGILRRLLGENIERAWY